MVTPKSPFLRSAVLLYGFGTTVAMWGAGYVCRLPVVAADSSILAAVMVVLLPIGGALAARETRSASAGTYTGLLAAVLNLLILGSFLTSPDSPNDLVRSPLLWVPGFLAAGAVLGGIGGLVGARLSPLPEQNDAWAGRFALVAAAATLLLVVAGGLVTGEEAGMAVPDWPNSFTYNMFLYPMSRMDGGIYYEHAHRLFGTLVGLATLALAVLVVRRRESPGARRLAIATFCAVCIQGVLGGLRVTEDSWALAVFHAVLGQAIFAALLAVAAMTSRTWRGDEPPLQTQRTSTDRKLAMAFLLLVLAQIALGAFVRQLTNRQIEGAVSERQLNAFLHFHITGAVLVFFLGLTTGFRIWGLYEKLAPLRKTGLAILALTICQVGLGLGALIAAGATADRTDPSAADVLVTTAHQAVGALLIAAAAVAIVWTRRLLSPLTPSAN